MRVRMSTFLDDAAKLDLRKVPPAVRQELGTTLREIATRCGAFTQDLDPIGADPKRARTFTLVLKASVDRCALNSLPSHSRSRRAGRLSIVAASLRHQRRGDRQGILAWRLWQLLVGSGACDHNALYNPALLS
jgi:hypothetical protein